MKECLSSRAAPHLNEEVSPALSYLKVPQSYHKDCVCYFLCFCNKIPDKKKLVIGEARFSSWLEGYSQPPEGRA